MTAARMEALVLSSLLADPPPVLIAPTLLRALGLVPTRPVEGDVADWLELTAPSPAERVA